MTRSVPTAAILLATALLVFAPATAHAGWCHTLERDLRLTSVRVVHIRCATARPVLLEAQGASANWHRPGTVAAGRFRCTVTHQFPGEFAPGTDVYVVCRRAGYRQRIEVMV